MAQLSTDQLADFRADLSDIDPLNYVWEDDALHRLYTRAESSYELALWYAIRQLYLASLSENDYTAGQTSERRDQIKQGLKAALDTQWQIVTRSGNQVAIAGMRAVPPVEKDVPFDAEHPAEKSLRHDTIYRWRWWRP